MHIHNLDSYSKGCKYRTFKFLIFHKYVFFVCLKYKILYNSVTGYIFLIINPHPSNHVLSRQLVPAYTCIITLHFQMKLIYLKIFRAEAILTPTRRIILSYSASFHAVEDK